MKYLLIPIVLISNMALCQVTENVSLLDSRSVQLNYDGTYRIISKKAEEKRTYSQLKKRLRGKSIAEVRQMLGIKPWFSAANSTVVTEDGTFYYPYGVSKRVAKGAYLHYRDFAKILWNPVLEQYEDFCVHFYKGKFFSIQKSPGKSDTVTKPQGINPPEI